LVGTLTDAPVLNQSAYRYGLANEGGVFGANRLLKNVMGLWLLQECQRAWARAGQALTHEAIEGMGAQAAPFGPYVDPDDARFYAPSDMPAMLQQAAKESGQSAPETIAGQIRAIFESLAMKYRYTLECIEAATGQKLPCIHIVGGGSKNRLLNQLTADYCNKPVIAGPTEATAMGNACIQLMGMGRLNSPRAMRALIRASCQTTRFTPQHTAAHAAHYARFLKSFGLTKPIA
jgi:sugar (pentulose or hexulose) kinase